MGMLRRMLRVWVCMCVYVYVCVFLCIYIYTYTYILNNDSAGAYQHYSSYKKEGHDVYGKGNRLAI